MGRHREFDMDRVLDGAMDVIWRRGYAAAPIGDLCRAMGLNPGSVYGAFGNKHGLFLKVMERYLERMNRPGLDRMAAAPDGRDGIRAYFDFMAEGIVTGNRRWGCLGTNAFLELKEDDPDVARIMSEHLARLRAAFAAALRRAGDPRSEARAAYLLCVAQGLNVVARTGPDRATLDQIVDEALRGLSAPPSEEGTGAARGTSKAPEAGAAPAGPGAGQGAA